MRQGETGVPHTQVAPHSSTEVKCKSDVIVCFERTIGYGLWDSDGQHGKLSGQAHRVVSSSEKSDSKVSLTWLNVHVKDTIICY